MQEGFITLNRKIINWEWYKNTNTKILFLHCLLKANWTDGEFEGHKIPRGSFVTSIRKLAKETGLTVKGTRIALEHLKTTHEVAQLSTSKFSIITVVNYSMYQDRGTDNGKQGAQTPPKRGNNRTIYNNKNNNIYAISSKKKTQTHNFEQREYDFDKLEEELRSK